MSSNGKVALVTGGGSGIGKAAAIALAKEGFAVVIGGRRVDRLQEVAHEIEGFGGQVLAVPTDVTVKLEIRVTPSSIELLTDGKPTLKWEGKPAQLALLGNGRLTGAIAGGDGFNTLRGPNAATTWTAYAKALASAQPDRAALAVTRTIQGTNTGANPPNLILAPAPEHSPSPSPRTRQLLVLSARTETALAQAGRGLADFLDKHHPASYCRRAVSGDRFRDWGD